MTVRKLEPLADFPATARSGQKLKRALDVTLALSGIAAAAPLMLLIAAVLALESPSQIVFAQRRIGRYGRPFTLYKFRKFPATLDDGSGPSVTVANDARMTRFGALLERSKLDELPQLWNILKGDMSFVGPRPESPRFAHLYQGRYRALLDYLPGIFGPAQTRFRNESDMYPLDQDPETFYEQELFARKARLDLGYYPHSGCLRDLLWMLRGVWISVAGCLRWRRILRNSGWLMLADLAAVAASWTLVNLLRFFNVPNGTDLHVYLFGLALFPPLLVAVLALSRCYRYPQRHFSYWDAARLVRSATLAWLLGFLLLLAFARSASLYLAPTGWLMLLPALLWPRVRQRRLRNRSARTEPRSARVLIYGVGAGGVALSHWLDCGALDTAACGFLDDDASVRGQSVHGVPVLGSERDLPTLRQLTAFDEIWMTFMPDPAKRRRLQTFCRQHGVTLVVLPELEPFARHHGAHLTREAV